MARSEYQTLLDQKRELDAQIQAALERDKPGVVAEMREAIAAFGITEKDLFGPVTGTRKRAPSGPVEAKYRHPETGATWSGRGKAPKWLEGDRDKYLIADDRATVAH
jgi:DNA-binding protein H-NS